MSGSGSQQTTKQEIDPRMAALLYGNDGLFTKATTLYNSNPSGMNARMWEGMNKQYDYLNSPQYTQGYQRLLGVGGNLLSQGAAGNPFTGGGGVPRSGSMGFGSYAPPQFAQQAQTNAGKPNSSNTNLPIGGQEQRSAMGFSNGGPGGGGPQGYAPQTTLRYGMGADNGNDPGMVWAGSGYGGGPDAGSPWGDGYGGGGAPVEDHSFNQVPIDDHSTGYGTGGGLGGAGTWKSWYDELIGKH